MILVILGTQNKPFNRLLEKIDEGIINGDIKDEIIVQAGTTKYKSDNMKIFDFVPMNEFDNLIDKASIIITHGGVGTILSSIRKGKKVIAVPRLNKYKEHVNDHQIQIVNEFSKLGYILGCVDLDNLFELINNIDSFNPTSYKAGNDKMLNIIESFIGE